MPEWGGFSHNLLTYTADSPQLRLEANTALEIIGPLYERGACDAWPVRYEPSPGVLVDGYVHQWDLMDAEEIPSDPLTLSDEDEPAIVEPEICAAYGTFGSCPTEAEITEFCTSSPLFPVRARLVMAKNGLVYQDPALIPGWEGFGYLAAYIADAPVALEAGSTVEINGPLYEMGACDAWPVRFEVSPGVFKDGYVHEFDLKNAHQLATDP
jgi:hypothetical protein